MKQSSKKLLLWLYPLNSSSSRRRVPMSQVTWLLSELTPEGKLSLVRWLEKNELLFTDRLDGHLSLSLSSHGRRLLEAQFPALTRRTDSSKPDWSILIFLSAPSADSSFRYLRQRLIKEKLTALNRGVYLSAQKIGDELMQLLERSYKGNVIIVKYDKLLFGDELTIIGQKTQLNELMQAYSEISKDIEGLLVKKMQNKRLSDQQKKRIFTVFDRLLVCLNQDTGLIELYFPQVKRGIYLLEQLQNIGL